MFFPSQGFTVIFCFICLFLIYIIAHCIIFLHNLELYFYILAFNLHIWHNITIACSALSTDVRNISRKEVFIITNTTAKYKMLTADELQELISQVQQNSAEATARLCEAFRPLIYREGSRESIYRLLGEDAISIAWEIFLRFIRRYNGSD